MALTFQWWVWILVKAFGSRAGRGVVVHEVAGADRLAVLGRGGAQVSGGCLGYPRRAFA